MVRSGRKEKWILYTLVVLLCLVLASFWLMCNVYARYSVQTSGGDYARVAKFDVTEANSDFTQQITADVYPGFSQVYNVSVTNNSEVAISYVMDVKNKYGNLPLQFRMLDSTGTEITGSGADASAADCDLSESADISARDHAEHIYKLEISWPVPAGTVTSGENDLQDPDYEGKTDVIEITLKAIQKD